MRNDRGYILRSADNPTAPDDVVSFRAPGVPLPYARRKPIYISEKADVQDGRTVQQIGEYDQQLYYSQHKRAQWAGEIRKSIVAVNSATAEIFQFTETTTQIEIFNDDATGLLFVVFGEAAARNQVLSSKSQIRNDVLINPGEHRIFDVMVKSIAVWTNLAGTGTRIGVFLPVPFRAL